MLLKYIHVALTLGYNNDRKKADLQTQVDVDALRKKIVTNITKQTFEWIRRLRGDVEDPVTHGQGKWRQKKGEEYCWRS